MHGIKQRKCCKRLSKHLASVFKAEARGSLAFAHREDAADACGPNQDCLELHDDAVLFNNSNRKYSAADTFKVLFPAELVPILLPVPPARRPTWVLLHRQYFGRCKDYLFKLYEPLPTRSVRPALARHIRCLGWSVYIKAPLSQQAQQE